MVKLLFSAAAVYFLYKMFMGDTKQKQKTDKKEQENLVAKGEMVKDPVCGAYVSLENSVRTVKNGEAVHFCSYECRDKYLKQVESSNSDIG